MPNYTKLFNSIVTSTIWTEDDKTRILWITMLAMADQHGEVHASIPGLARIAGISTQDAESAIGKFLSPDPYSRTPDNEGRRIAPIDGGWELLNHAKYRRMASKEDSKEATAQRVRRHRERNATVTVCNAIVADQRDIAEAEADTKAEAKTPPLISMSDKSDGNGAASETIETLWKEFPSKSRERSSKKQVADEWRKTKNKPTLGEVLAAIMTFKGGQKWTKDNGEYQEGAHIWIRNRQWESVCTAQNTANGTHDGLQALASKIMALSPEWSLPLARNEMSAISDRAATIEALTDENWQEIRQYLSARHPEGSGAWIPRTRLKFIETIADVYSHAGQWARKNGMRKIQGGLI